MDWDFDEIQSQVEVTKENESITAVKATLENMVIDDEHQAEGSVGTVAE